MVAVVPRAFVIGQPIAHSRSPMLHGHWLRELGIAGSYEAIEVGPHDLADFLGRLAEAGFAGGNVTVPHKESAFRLVDERTSRAERLGTVNTLWLDGDRLVGDSTDGEGFVAHLDATLGPGWPGEARTTLLVGAGGAARAIAPALLDRGVERIIVANRTPERADDLARMRQARIVTAVWERLDATLGEASLLVNTTQLGMKGQPPLGLDLARLPARAVVADIVYVPLETELLASARRRGLRTVDGLGMLLHQAVPGFERWFGRRPAVTPALRALLAADIERRA